MTDLQTPRLSLHAIDTAEGERIVARRAAAEDAWAEDFPFDGDVIGVMAFLRATAAHGDRRPFGCYRIARTADGKAIGGIGFKGQPNNGCVKVGYGLAPSARGNGYAAEALAALLNVAADHGLPSRRRHRQEQPRLQRTLQRAGFHQVGSNGDLYTYEILIAAPPEQPICSSATPLSGTPLWRDPCPSTRSIAHRHVSANPRVGRSASRSPVMHISSRQIGA